MILQPASTACASARASKTSIGRGGSAQWRSWFWPTRIAGGGDLLLAGLGAEEARPDLEQAEVVVEAAALVARGRAQEVGQAARAQDRQLGVDRIAQPRPIAAEAARQLRLAERPGDRLGKAARGELAARERALALLRAQRGMADRLGPPHRHRRHAVVAVKPHQLLDHVGLHAHVVAPGRRPQLEHAVLDPFGAEAERPHVALDHGAVQRDAGQPLQLLHAKADRRVRRRARAPATIGWPACPPQSSRISRVAYSMPGITIAGSTPRSKRVRASLSMPSRRPVKAVRSGSNSATSSTTSVVPLVHAGALAAHDAAQADRARGVGDHRHVGVEPVGPAVERLERLAGPGEAQAEIAPELGGVEHVQRPAEVHGHQVGDVDQGRDRPQPDRGQPLLQPGRARAVAQAAQDPADEQRAGRPLARRKVEADPQPGLEGARNGREIARSQRAEPGGRELARDPEHAEAVAPVRRHRDLDQRALDPDHLGGRPADRRVGRQLDDAVVIRAEQQLGRRAQHAGALDAADLRAPQHLAGAWDQRPDRREHRLHPGMHVGRPAHHQGHLAAGVDPAEAEPLGVRVGAHLGDHGDPEGREIGAAALDRLDLEAEHGELGDDLVQRSPRSRDARAARAG